MHVPPSLKIAHVPGKEKIGEVTSNLRKKLSHFRQGQGVTDADLLDKAEAAYEKMHKEKEASENSGGANKDVGNLAVVAGNHRNGFMILGMHRSGTSMLGGLLNKSAGYIAGGPLIRPANDNENGFFERIDIGRVSFMKSGNLFQRLDAE